MRPQHTNLKCSAGPSLFEGVYCGMKFSGRKFYNAFILQSSLFHIHVGCSEGGPRFLFHSGLCITQRYGAEGSREKHPGLYIAVLFGTLFVHGGSIATRNGGQEVADCSGV